MRAGALDRQQLRWVSGKQRPDQEAGCHTLPPLCRDPDRGSCATARHRNAELFFPPDADPRQPRTLVQVPDEILAIERHVRQGIRRPRCSGRTCGRAFAGRKLRLQAIEGFFDSSEFCLDAGGLRLRRRRIQRSQPSSLKPFLRQHLLRRPGRHSAIDQPPTFGKQHQEP